VYGCKTGRRHLGKTFLSKNDLIATNQWDDKLVLCSIARIVSKLDVNQIPIKRINNNGVVSAITQARL